MSKIKHKECGCKIVMVFSDKKVSFEINKPKNVKKKIKKRAKR